MSDFTNKYPYLDYHELNLDWFLEEFKKVTDKVTTLDETVQQFTEFVTNYFDNLDVQQEINIKLNQMAVDGTLSALIQPFFDEYKGEIDEIMDDQNDRIAVLEGRMDEFASLPPGATSGNAELLDIRVKVDGTTAASAGDAVREQVTTLQDEIDEIRVPSELNLFNVDDITPNVFVDSTGTIQPGGGSYDLTDFIPIDGDLTMTYANTGTVSAVWVSYYNASKVWQNRLNYSGNTIHLSGTGYVRINLWSSTNATGQMDYSTIMINPGATAIPYVPYYSAYDSYARYFMANMDGAGIQVTISNYATVLPDADTTAANTNYVLTFSSGTTTLPANLPVTTFWTTSAALFCVGKSNVSRIQWYIDEDNIYYRRKTSAITWGNWVILAEAGNKTFYVGPGRTYTTLKDGIDAACAQFNSTLYVDPGTYDLVTEFGAAYFAAIDASSNSKQGLQLGNNVHIIFASNSKVVCNYTGGNPYVHEKFSPFNAAGPYGFTLENLDLECSMVRYCVHDERSVSQEAYRNEYINCRMYCDNRLNTDWASRQCIGGGLGESGEIFINGCYFESEESYANNGTVSYHNSSSANAKSHIVVQNSYFGGTSSTVRFGWYGTSTEVTECLVSGNSFSAAPVIRAETAGSTTVNMVMYDWNNEVRP